MRNLSRSAVMIGILTLVASGCNSLNSTVFPVISPAAQRHVSRHQKPWMLPEASSEDLLYIADFSAGGILVYSYTSPKYKLVGVLSPPTSDSNLCVDNQQDVYATQYNSLVEYKHGATSPLRILGGLLGYVDGCAVDATTGTLAVSNANENTRDELADVSFFKRSVARHTTLSLPKPYQVGQGIAYDGSGNLFITAYIPGTIPVFVLLELAKGSKQFVAITLSKTFVGGGHIAWDGQYLDFADPRKNVIYQYAIDGQRLDPKGTIVLARSYDIGGFFIDGSTLIVPASSTSDPSGFQPRVVNLYNYPAGGKDRRDSWSELSHKRRGESREKRTPTLAQLETTGRHQGVDLAIAGHVPIDGTTLVDSM